MDRADPRDLHGVLGVSVLSVIFLCLMILVCLLSMHVSHRRLVASDVSLRSDGVIVISPSSIEPGSLPSLVSASESEGSYA